MRLGGALKSEEYSESNASQTRTCDVPGCGETTRENKLFCTEHVERHPYVQHLLKRIENRDAEDEQVRMQGSSAVNLDGITVQEITLQLRKHGTRTVERITREINLDASVIRSYVIAMKEAGLVTMKWTARNALAVTLLNRDPEDEIED